MKLPQLTLRDLFWLVLVCALGLGLWQQRRQHSQDLQNCKYHATFLMEYMQNHGFRIEVDASGGIGISPPGDTQ